MAAADLLGTPEHIGVVQRRKTNRGYKGRIYIAIQLEAGDKQTVCVCGVATPDLVLARHGDKVAFTVCKDQPTQLDKFRIVWDKT